MSEAGIRSTVKPFVHIGISNKIALPAIARVVRRSIHLNDEASGGAIEVGNVRADGVLTTKAQMMIAGLQRLPQQDLRQGHLPAEAAGGVCLRASHGPNPPSTTRLRRAVPLPVNGEDFHRLHSGYFAAQASLFTSIQDWQEPLARSLTRPM